jgi:hypothetical protein
MYVNLYVVTFLSIYLSIYLSSYLLRLKESIFSNYFLMIVCFMIVCMCPWFHSATGKHRLGKHSSVIVELSLIAVIE